MIDRYARLFYKPARHHRKLISPELFCMPIIIEPRLKNKLLRKLQRVNTLREFVIDAYHYWYYHQGHDNNSTWSANTFLGVPIQQNPLDMQLYQELIFREKPEFILQTGVCSGGSIQYFATLLDAMGADRSIPVIGVDILLLDSAKALTNPRVKLIEGSSIAPEVIEKARALVAGKRGLVILDSDHSRDHVLAEMRLYKEFVAPDCYMVVEDTNVNGNPVLMSHGPGPLEAVNDYFKEDPDTFVQDDDFWRRNGFSHHQYGWLKRVK